MALLKAEYSSLGEPGKRGFEDLDCFKLALDVIVNAHEFARKLPPEEKFDMAAQIRGSAKSITANIAEGYGRYHYLDSLKFYSNARGSLNETLSQFINARVLKYIDQPSFDELYQLCRQTERTLNGYMAFVRRQHAGDDDGNNRMLRDELAEYHPDDESGFPSSEDLQQTG
ncbi:MAG TPA: four helix bundle protein [Anaerolineales bacterium]|nr:four helix bundle protein [Anaerolineales bacterium]